MSLGSTAGPLGDWAVSAAMTPGQVGSWFVDGTLTARPSSSHRYVGGLVYGAQRVNSTDLFALSAMSGGSRSVGRVFGFDEWIVSKYLAVGYGLSYMWQDYVATEGLVSPRVSMTVSPVRGLRLRAVAARNSVAPGSEEFINVMDHSLDRPWLPAHRSFSPWSERDGLPAQTTDHFEFGVERDVAAYVVGVQHLLPERGRSGWRDLRRAVARAPGREPRPLLPGQPGRFRRPRMGRESQPAAVRPRARVGRLLGDDRSVGAAGPTGLVPPGSAARAAPSRPGCTT